MFVSPWIFAYASGAARIDFWASSALIAVVSAAAIAAFSDWEEWLNLLLGVSARIGALDTQLRPQQSDAY